MEKFTPSEMFDLYKKKQLSKNELIRNLLIRCEYSESNRLRVECLDIINEVESKSTNLFKILEEFAISDSNEDVRLIATDMILESFPEKGIEMVEYLIKNFKNDQYLMKFIKKIGQNFQNLSQDQGDYFLELIRPIFIELFETADFYRFKNISGVWCNYIPKNYWNFIKSLKNSIGLLELFDTILEIDEIREWFFKDIIKIVDIEIWIMFMNNLKFSGLLLNILMYLAEEKPETFRYYQFIFYFQELGKNINEECKKKIYSILKNGDYYFLSVCVIFRWLEYLSPSQLKYILEDSDFNLIKRLKIIFQNEIYGFSSHNVFIEPFIPLLMKICKYIEEKYVVQFLFGLKVEEQEKFLYYLFEYIRSKPITKSETEKIYQKEIKYFVCKLLKFLSHQYDFSKFNLLKFKKKNCKKK